MERPSDVDGRQSGTITATFPSLLHVVTRPLLACLRAHSLASLLAHLSSFLPMHFEGSVCLANIGESSCSVVIFGAVASSTIAIPLDRSIRMHFDIDSFIDLLQLARKVNL